MNANERFKSKNKTKSRHIQIDDLGHRKCNGIIKGWRQCQTSVSKGRFFVSNILMFGSAWCLVIAQIQFFLIKENKDWTSRELPTLLRPIKSYFCFSPPPATLSNWTSYVHHPLFDRNHKMQLSLLRRESTSFIKKLETVSEKMSYRIYIISTAVYWIYYILETIFEFALC